MEQKISRKIFLLFVVCAMLMGGFAWTGPVFAQSAAAGAESVEDKADKARAFYNEFMDSLMKRREQYEQRLVEVGWPGMLDLRRLQKDRGDASRCRSIINEVRLSFDKYVEDTMRMQEWIRKNILFLDIDQGTKDEIIRQHDDGCIKWTHFKDKEERVIAEYEAIVKILEENEKKWGIQNAGLVFENPEAVKFFRQHMSNIEAVSNE